MMELWLGLGYVDTADLVRVAVACEQAGVAGVSMSDHLVRPGRLDSAYPYSRDGSIVWEPETHWPDSWVAIGAMAAATTTLRFGTGVFVAPLREPVALAKAVSTAAEISGGRVVCGLGSGWMREEFDVVGQDFDSRGRRLDEITEILRKLWSGEIVEHSGPHYRFPPVQMVPAPAVPIPIWIGGNTPAAMRRAARHDGWIGAFGGLEQARSDLQAFRRVEAERPGPTSPVGAATVGPMRRPEVLRGLADAGFDAAIVPIPMLTRGRGVDAWLEAIERAAALAQEAGLGTPA